MTRLLCLAALFLLVAGPATAAEEDGAAVFGIYCSSCHGATGAGDGAAAAALTPAPANLNDAEFWKTRDEEHIRKVITEGGAAVGKSPLMAAWGAVLSKEQLAAVVKYVVSKKDTAGAAPADDASKKGEEAPPDAPAGEETPAAKE